MLQKLLLDNVKNRFAHVFDFRFRDILKTDF